MPDPFTVWSQLLDTVEGVTLDLDPNDSGNWTGGAKGAGVLRGSKRGVSAAAFPTLDIANLDDQDVAIIRRVHYWNPIVGDELPGAVAIEVADTAYNHGVRAAGIDLQTALGVTADGAIGPVTLNAVGLWHNRIDDLLINLIAARGVRYAGDKNAALYLRGWMRRLATVAKTSFRF